MEPHPYIISNVNPGWLDAYRLNLVAPDIIKAIVNGKQPRDLMLQDLMKKIIPDLWQEQKQVFGF